MRLQDRVRSLASNWRALGASPKVLRWIEHGYELDFRSYCPRFHGRHLKIQPHQRSEWEILLEQYQSNGALVEVDESQACYCSPAFLVGKFREGRRVGWRLIVDLRFLNTHLHDRSCRYETLAQLKGLIKKGSWLASIDLTDAYHHVGIAPEHQKFLCFGVKVPGAPVRYFQFSALPFGLKPAPLVFTKVARVLVRALRAPSGQLAEAVGEVHDLGEHWSHEEPISPYIDDFLLVAESFEACEALIAKAILCCGLLGFQWSSEKSVLTPTQCLQHLGLVIDTAAGVFTLSLQKRQALAKGARLVMMTVVQHARVCSKALVAKFCGLAASVQLALPSVPLYLRSLYDCLSQQQSWAHGVMVRLSHQAIKDLKFFLNIPEFAVGGALWPLTPEVELFTDSSDFGWGGVCTTTEQTARALWDLAESDWHINLKELTAIRYALLSLLETVKGKVVSLKIDSLVVFYQLRKWASTVPAAMVELRRLQELLLLHRIQLVPNWIPSTENLADHPSREVEKEDWRLCDEAFALICSKFGRPTCERFASMQNHHLPVYNSKDVDVFTAGVDAFEQTDWEQQFSYCNPPWSLLTKLVGFLSTLDRCHCLVVSPWWPRAAWFPPLARLAQQYMFLPPAPNLFAPASRFNRWGVGAPKWRVVVWHLRWNRGRSQQERLAVDWNWQ